MRDALRLMPVLGVGLFMLPLLWPAGTEDPGAPVRLSVAVMYVFVAWATLIALSAAVWALLRSSDGGT